MRQNIQQRGFTASGWPHKDYKFSFEQADVCATQSGDIHFAHAIHASDFACFEDDLAIFHRIRKAGHVFRLSAGLVLLGLVLNGSGTVLAWLLNGLGA